jgi:hypothetical protein
MSLPPWHAEIVELHDLFTAWLDGTTPAGELEAVLARTAATQEPEFVFITPGGQTLPREALLDDLRTAHGSRPGWRMWVENARLHAAHGELTVVTYEEWHRLADGTVTGRATSAVLRAKPGTPNGLSWLLVHETWLPEAVQRQRQEQG